MTASRNSKESVLLSPAAAAFAVDTGQSLIADGSFALKAG